MQKVCVFGASRNKLDEKYFNAAFRVGELLGEHGIDMVFGGGDKGLMGAAARGIRSKGGRIIGVIPEKLNRPGIAYPECDELIVTPTMHSRKAKMEEMSDGFIALPGGFGTIEEIMEVITLKQLGYFDAPIVMLDQDGFYSSLIHQLEGCIETGFTDPAFSALYTAAATPDEAVNAVLQYRPTPMPDKIKDVLSR